MDEVAIRVKCGGLGKAVGTTNKEENTGSKLFHNIPAFMVCGGLVGLWVQMEIFPMGIISFVQPCTRMIRSPFFSNPNVQ
jgi:hypothetical protein